MVGLKPEVSLPIGLATAAVVYAIHSNFTPTIAEIRHADPGDQNIRSSRRAAAWLSAGVVAGISLLAKDPTIFVIGSIAVVGLDFFTRHAELVNPMTGVASVRSAQKMAVDQGYVVDDTAGVGPAYV